jgi:hypothetical protein
MLINIPAARFFLCELHSVMGDKWGGRVRLAPQLRRDLQCRIKVPKHANGKKIQRPVETAYIHYDTIGHFWGAVLNGKLDARGLWGQRDETHHMTWKDMKAVRLAVLNFSSTTSFLQNATITMDTSIPTAPY